MQLQQIFHSVPVDTVKNLYALVFDSPSMPDAIQIWN